MLTLEYVAIRIITLAVLTLPLLGGCRSSNLDQSAPSLLTLPDCKVGDFIIIQDDLTLECAGVLTSDLQPPSCPADTHALNAVESGLTCVAKGTNSGTTGSELAGAISAVVARTQMLKTQIIRLNTIGSGAKYCGQTGNQPSADFLNGTATGIAAAGSLCAKVPSCGMGANLCSVYEMYQSVASGVITDAQDLSKSWVYMASWSQEFSDNSGLAKEPGAGLADNCGGYTVSDSTKKWFGTAVQWTASDSGKKALKFFSGPPNIGIPGTTATIVNPGAVPCDSVLPIACCI